MLLVASFLLVSINFLFSYPIVREILENYFSIAELVSRFFSYVVSLHLLSEVVNSVEHVYTSRLTL